MRPKTPIGAKRMMPPVSFIIAWKPALKKSVKTLRGFSSRDPMVIPKTMQKKIIASILASDEAATMFSGTTSSSSSLGEVAVDSSGSVPPSMPAN